MARVTGVAVTIGMVVGLFVLLLVYSVDIHIVTTGSMRPTLVPGDVVVCVSATISIGRGDIVAFGVPHTSDRGIKRIVGVPTDHVIYDEKQLTINGGTIEKHLLERLPNDNPSDLLLEQSLFGRNFAIHESYGGGLTNIDATLGYEYFLMGDSRDESVDSRHFGGVPTDAIACKVLGIVATEVDGRFSFARMGFVR